MDIKKNFIDGKWVNGTLGRNIEVVNPATGEVIALVSESSVDDVKKAILAAKKSFYVTRESGEIWILRQEQILYLK